MLLRWSGAKWSGMVRFPGIYGNYFLSPAKISKQQSKALSSILFAIKSWEKFGTTLMCKRKIVLTFDVKNVAEKRNCLFATHTKQTYEPTNAFSRTHSHGQTPGNTKNAYELVWKYLNIMWFFDKLAELQVAYPQRKNKRNGQPTTRMHTYLYVDLNVSAVHR